MVTRMEMAGPQDAVRVCNKVQMLAISKRHPLKVFAFSDDGPWDYSLRIVSPIDVRHLHHILWGKTHTVIQVV